ncbi:unnamed protein product [Paramecium pentaurelia]|uniref:RING-type domain-containing protein n=1 Tax=Paramecium pentaurelia TaxID=43138 RepID=A0A8S1UM52_9CILI|nr:unnamed protein product [Paramecium pentaurelia]
MKGIESLNKSAYFKEKYLNPNNIFNQIETNLRLIKEKCEQQKLKLISQNQMEMFQEVLDHLNNIIQCNSDRQIIFKQNHQLIIDYQQQQYQLTNYNMDSQMKYGVTLIFPNQMTIEEVFSDQLTFKEFYHFLLKKFSDEIKQMFVILDQDTNIINPDDWDQPFIYGNKQHSLFFIQSLQFYIMQQQKQEIRQETYPINQKVQIQQNDFKHQIFQSHNVYPNKDMKKESLNSQFHSSILKNGYSLMNVIQYKCQQCNQSIQNKLIMLKCFHNYHEDCLCSMLKIQIESNQPTLNCLCNKKIKINEVNVLNKVQIERLYQNQINVIYQKQQALFIKCNKCQFFYIKAQNKSQIRQVCLMCQV